LGDLQLSLYAASPDGGRVLGRIAAAFLVVSVLWALAAVFVPVWNPATPLALLGPLPWLGALVAARAGGLCAAYWILVAGLWATLTAYAVFWGGIHSPSLAGYAVLVLVAGALGTSRSAIAAAVLSAGSLVAFLLAEWWWGRPPGIGPESPLTVGLTVMSCVLGAGIVTTNLTGRLRSAHSQVGFSREAVAKSEKVAYTAQERYEEIASLTSEFFYSLVRHPDGRFETEFVTDAFEQITGYKASSFGHDDWWKLIHPEDRGRLRDRESRRVSSSELDSVVDHRIVTASGDVRWLRDHSRLVSRPDGTQRLYGASKDITADIEHREESRRLQEEQRQSQKMEEMGRLASGVAHDFNNLLTVISGFAELLEARTEQDEEAKEAAGQILEASARASDLTAQLLSVSRRSVHRAEVVDFRALILRVEPMFRRLLSETIEVVIRTGDDALLTRGDPSLLEQVLLNLVVNSRDAMAGRGRLVIEAERVELGSGECRGLEAGDYVRLCVEDDGSGMVEEVRVRALEPYFTTKEVGRGSGLGLSTVQGIVEQCGGLIELDSRVGRGTKVRIHLPASASEASAPLARVPRERSVDRVRPGTILVVEDEVKVRELVGKWLERAGHRALLCDLPSAAMEVFRSCGDEIDLVISDIAMPERDGTDLVKDLRKIRASLPCILMSGNPNYAGGDERELPPDVPFLQKPFASGDFFAEVNRVLS